VKKDLKTLYKTVILQHNKLPFHFEKKENAPFVIEAYNSLCGDRFQVFLEHKNGIITTLHFHGYGCAISKASTSVLVKQLTGQSIEEGLASCKAFLKTLQTDSTTTPDNEELAAFMGAKDFPGRAKGATLAWDELVPFLESLLPTVNNNS